MKSDNQFLATNCWQTVQDNPFSFQRSVDVALVNCSGKPVFFQAGQFGIAADSFYTSSAIEP